MVVEVSQSLLSMLKQRDRIESQFLILFVSHLQDFVADLLIPVEFDKASFTICAIVEFAFPLKASVNKPKPLMNPEPKMCAQKTDTTIPNEATFTFVHKFLPSFLAA